MITRLARLCGFGAEAVETFARNGLLRPVPPADLARMVEAFRHFHVTPATGVAMAAARWPDRPAIFDEDGCLTFSELDERVVALASALYDRFGVRPGRTVAIMWPNHRGFVEAVAAVSRLGADLLLLNTGLAGPRLRDVLRREDVRTLIAAPELPPVDFAGTRVGDLDELIASATGPEPPAPRRPGRLVLLTSGTTGVPKGATRRLSLTALAEPFTSMLATVPLRTGEPILIAPPLFHGLGLLWYGVALVLGCPVVLTRRFDPETVLRALDRHRATAMVAVPVMLKRLLAHDVQPLPHLRVVVSGGSALPPDLATAFRDAYGDVLYNLYGSTEVGWATLATPADLWAAPDTIGRPTRGTTVVIAGPDGRELPPYEVGRVLVGGGLTFSGYSGGGASPEAGGLLSTGDLGHRDGRGRLFIDGREDDMIVSGGENVFPQEVENLLGQHPGVADVAVLGVPDEEYGQRLAAYVVREPGARLSADQLKQAVKAELGGYKVPRDIVFVTAVPRNQTGKVDRRRLGGTMSS
ncbi:AMP-binding protein [Nonomuraea sp. NEAU-A123]|uniref:AMP-binding protein n=1 Tax=Nonomuraea sp. NEAU-A123 TaxID=2839649 RepID=UPI001BE3E54C|nr:AMP-binding protein [Nonomuraea sp. NEAU-A123]MBT2232484.1 AMP-binding protein [Nonomuraea sp. NEAU-A123]